MIALNKLLFLVGLALLAAIASFEDRLALIVGGLALAAAAGFLLMFVAGVAMSLRRRRPIEKNLAPFSSAAGTHIEGAL